MSLWKYDFIFGKEFPVLLILTTNKVNAVGSGDTVTFVNIFANIFLKIENFVQNVAVSHPSTFANIQMFVNVDEC